MRKALNVFCLSLVLSFLSTAAAASPDYFYTDIVKKRADVTGDGRLETVRLAGEVDLNSYDLDSYSSFENQFIEFVNTRIFIEDYRGLVIYSGKAPHGLFEKLLLSDFTGDGADDILFSFHDSEYPNIDHIVLSFKDNKLVQLFNGQLGHNGLDATRYLNASIENNYGVKLNSVISGLNVSTVLSRDTRDLYSAFYDKYGEITNAVPTFITYPYLSDIDADNDGVSELLEFSKLKTALGEDILAIQTVYKWKSGSWLPYKISAAPLNYSINVSLNGKHMFFDSEPIIRRERTLVPMRAIFEALNADIVWNEAEKAVTAYRGGTEIEVKLDEATAYINNIPLRLDVAPMILDGRTMVPVRFVSEALGAFVDWDDLKREVVIETR